MGYVIHSVTTRLEDEDFRWMVGRSVDEIRFAEPGTWWFSLSGGGMLKTDGGVWRVLRSASMVTCSLDHGHQFGLPARWDAVTAAQTALEGARVVEVRVDDGAPDLRIRLDNGLILELLALSSGCECWQTCDPSGRCVVVHGSRDASTWQEPGIPPRG